MTIRFHLTNTSSFCAVKTRPIAFCTPDEANPERAPTPKAGKTVFVTIGKALAANPAKRPRKPPSILVLCLSYFLVILIVIPLPFS